MSLATLLRLQHPDTRHLYRVFRLGTPMQLVTMDIVGPFTESTTGSQYILVVSDYFTKCVEAYAIPNQEALTIAKVLVDEFFCRFGPPRQLHSDQGRQLEFDLIEEICTQLQIKKSHTSPHPSQSDRQVECFNRTLLHMLATAMVLGGPLEEGALCLRHQCALHNHLHTFLSHVWETSCPPS